MGCGNKRVVSVFACVQGSHAIEFAEENRSQQVVDGEWVVRVPLQHLVELLNCAVVVKIVEMVESCEVQRIIRAAGQHIGRASGLSVGRRRRPCDEQEAQKRNTAGWKPDKHVRGLYSKGAGLQFT